MVAIAIAFVLMAIKLPMALMTDNFFKKRIHRGIMAIRLR